MEYLDILRDGLQKAYAAASEARAKGFDPADDVEVKIAKDIAARVEGIVGPPGIADLIRSLEKAGMAREDIAFEVCKKIASGEIIKGEKERLIEQSVRTGLGILTEGVLVAPTEGIAKVHIKQNPDGSDYVAVYYSGPIRSAGGTAVALSLVLADIARRICGVGDYRPTDSQVMRYVEEVTVYETRCVHLQYLPPEEDIRVIVGHCPICIDGEPTEEVEVSAYRDVPGVETNRVRGGVPLVICDGVALKASKLFKYTKRLKLGWDWLEKIIKIKKKEDKIEIKPDSTYLEGLVAGRPVFSHASAKGGFRLRYGRSKTTCLMAKDIHPAIMVLLDDFLAYGTHMKIERPGKGCVVSAHEGLEPPVVRLNSGRVMKVRTLEEAYAVKADVAEVLFLGDLLCTYGDFLKSNHPLMPSGWCEEWWQRELEAKGLEIPQAADAQSLFTFSATHGVPLHPSYTYHWHDLSAQQMHDLAQWLAQGKLDMDGDTIRSMILPPSEAKRALEELLVEHRVHDGSVILEGGDAYILLRSLGSPAGKIDLSAFNSAWSEAKGGLQLVNELSGVKIKAKAPTYIGARMGRPEKAKERKMDGSPHVLFPTGSFKNRSITKQYRMLKGREGEKTVNLELARMRCTKCNRLGFYRRCDVCGSRAMADRVCQKCGRPTESEIHCDVKTLQYDRRPVDVVELFEGVKSRLEASPEEVKGVKGLSNAIRMPERLEKGFLRAKHDTYVFRDGTSRFDATDVPLTHFTPAEIGVTVEQLRELGYAQDYLGNPLTSPAQVLAIRHQDIILSEYGGDYFVRVANFMDDLLVSLYGMKAFYNVKKRADLLGHLFVGLSPHTSAGVLCRVIGFTKANVGYAHPYFHTAKRRNCFHGDEKLLVHDGTLRLLTLRELAETYLQGKCERDDFGTRYKRVAGLKTFAFNKKTKKFELADITHISRHPAPASLVELRTKTGRRIMVTPDHPFPDRHGNKIPAKDAEELLIPWNVAAPAPAAPSALDMLSVADEDAMIRTEEPIFDEGAVLSEISRDLGLSYKTFTNYVYRKSYPLQMVRRFRPGILRSRNFALGSKRDHISVKPDVPLNDDFLSLLGFYLAEGYIKNKQKNSQQVSIAASKPWAKRYLSQTISRVFGLDASVSGNAVTICSGFVLELFRKLRIGNGARSKRIPDFIYALPEDKIAAFLRGYFSGDGSCSLGSTLEVNVTSVNKWLIDGASVLLNLLGIRHSIVEEKRAINSDIILRFYGRPKNVIEFKVRIYGDAARKFIEKVGFIDQKQENAKSLLGRWVLKQRKSRAVLEGDAFVDRVVSRKSVPCTEKYVYNLTVSPHHSLICSGIASFQCDGDEDCVMLLMDALLNFSRKYLDEKRGGTMDAPLVLSMDINPKEVDDEAHNI
ncbi:MAG: DNA polymerase II large subunit, partial [Candidatus ainarchaeum sp.]|nr:DNA polymerase II large subunit [Candidatus ainarchaeum sp.]